MDHQSTIKFSCPLDFQKETLLSQITSAIDFINLIDNEFSGGKSYYKNEKMPISHLIERLEALKNVLNSKNTPDELDETFFSDFATANSDWGGLHIIDLESNEIEFDESICYDGYSMSIFMGTEYLSKYFEKLCADFVETINIPDNDMTPSIFINDFDENYIEIYKNT
jgi:hypothetical protein